MVFCRASDLWRLLSHVLNAGRVVICSAVRVVGCVTGMLGEVVLDGRWNVDVSIAVDVDSDGDDVVFGDIVFTVRVSASVGAGAGVRGCKGDERANLKEMLRRRDVWPSLWTWERIHLV